MKTWSMTSMLVLALPSCTVDLIIGADVYVPSWEGDVPSTQPTVDTEDPGVVTDDELCDGVDNDGDLDVDEGDVCARTETFDQVADVDVLLVVDPRDAAQGVRDRLVNGLQGMVEPHLGDGRSAQFAVLSMGGDPHHLGRLVSLEGASYAETASGDIGAMLDFLHDATGAVAGTHVAARQATQLAIDEYRHFKPNLGFDRNETFLSLVYLTTTEDHSLPYPDELVEILDEFQGPYGWSAHVVAQLEDSDCTGEHAPQHRAKTLADLAIHSGGMLLSHCEEDYGAFLEAMSTDAAMRVLRSTFWLEGPPQKTTTSVELALGADVRTLDPSEFTLKDEALTLNEAPAAGTQITVSYMLDAGPKHRR
ncbi:MAG: hypothetical protein KTR31_35395 [Myxococcales bacterium]|nr:hypothetical protein [Myxococcales bacterium]